MVGLLHRLIGNANRTAAQHGFGEFTFAGKMKVSEDHLPLPYERIFRSNGLFHLHNHVGNGIHLFDSWQHLRTGFTIAFIRESTLLTC